MKPRYQKIGVSVVAAILLLSIVGTGPVLAQADETTDPGECDYASDENHDGDHTEEQANADTQGQADCHGEHHHHPPYEQPIRE